MMDIWTIIITIFILLLSIGVIYLMSTKKMWMYGGNYTMGQMVTDDTKLGIDNNVLSGDADVDTIRNFGNAVSQRMDKLMDVLNKLNVAQGNLDRLHAETNRLQSMVDYLQDQLNAANRRGDDTERLRQQLEQAEAELRESQNKLQQELDNIRQLRNRIAQLTEEKKAAITVINSMAKYTNPYPIYIKQIENLAAARAPAAHVAGKGYLSPYGMKEQKANLLHVIDNDHELSNIERRDLNRRIHAI